MAEQYSNLKLNQLEYFKVLAHTGHVTKAAEKLCITQSTLSKTIAALEAELGYSLFDHKRGSIRLNERGQAFLRGVESSLNILNSAISFAETGETRSSGDFLRVSTPYPYSYAYIGDVIGEFLTDYPNAKIVNETTNNVYEMMGHLSAGSIDCVIGSPDMPTDKQFAWTQICAEPFVAVVHKDASSQLHMEESIQRFRDWNFCLSAPETDQRLFEEKIFQTAGFAPNIIYEGTDQPYVIGHMRIPNCVGMIPASSVRTIPSSAEVSVISLKEDYCSLILGVYYLKNNNNLFLQRFIQHMQKRILVSKRPIV